MKQKLLSLLGISIHQRSYRVHPYTGAFPFIAYRWGWFEYEQFGKSLWVTWPWSDRESLLLARQCTQCGCMGWTVLCTDCKKDIECTYEGDFLS